MELKNKELQEIKTQVSTVQQSAMSLVVENKEDMAKVADLRHNVTQAQKFILSRKEEITRPLMKSLASIRDLFVPLESSLKNAKSIIDEKVKAWDVEETNRIETQQAKLASKVASGYMKAETAAGKLETLGEVSKMTEGSTGKMIFRSVPKVRIIDETLIPREYMVPSHQDYKNQLNKITEAIIRQGLTISGCELYVEKQIVSR